MIKRRYLVDGNSIGFAAHSGTRLSAGEQETQAVFGSLKTVRKLIADRLDANVIVLWDGRSWRRDVVEDYKANRDKTQDQRDTRAAYKSQTAYTRAAFKTLGIPQLVAENYEADDLASMLVQRFSDKGEPVRLITRDKDWLQLVRNDVVWEDHKTGELVGEKDLLSKTGFSTARAFLHSKALTGDAGDNLPGVGGIGAVNAKRFFDCWNDVLQFWAESADDIEDVWVSVHATKLPKAIKDLHQSEEKRARFRENLRLMDLINPDNLPSPVGLQLIKTEPNPALFRKLCVQLGFHSILNAFDGFVNPFLERHAQ